MEDAFCLLGHSVGLCQAFEQEIAAILTMSEIVPGQHPAKSDAVVYYEDTMADRMKQTLGTLLKKFQLADTIPNGKVILEDALRARNWLVHDSIRENCELMLSREGEFKVISRIDDAQANVGKALQMLEPIKQKLFECLGYSQEQRNKDGMKFYQEFFDGWRKTE